MTDRRAARDAFVPMTTEERAFLHALARSIARDMIVDEGCANYARALLSTPGGEAPREEPSANEWCAKCKRPWRPTIVGCCKNCGHGWSQNWPEPAGEVAPTKGADVIERCVKCKRERPLSSHKCEQCGGIAFMVDHVPPVPKVAPAPTPTTPPPPPLITQEEWAALEIALGMVKGLVAEDTIRKMIARLRGEGRPQE